MILVISSFILIACFVAILSGIWVIVGLVTELINRSNSPSVSPRAGASSRGNAQKKQNSSEFL